MNNANNDKNLAQDIQEMMNAWNKIQAAARAQFPKASEEQIYQLTAGAMNYSLGLK